MTRARARAGLLAALATTLSAGLACSTAASEPQRRGCELDGLQCGPLRDAHPVDAERRELAVPRGGNVLPATRREPAVRPTPQAAP